MRAFGRRPEEALVKSPVGRLVVGAVLVAAIAGTLTRRRWDSNPRHLAWEARKATTTRDDA
jgi:hypothetical protein